MLGIEPYKNALVKINVNNNSSFSIITQKCTQAVDGRGGKVVLFLLFICKCKVAPTYLPYCVVFVFLLLVLSCRVGSFYNITSINAAILSTPHPRKGISIYIYLLIGCVIIQIRNMYDI